MTQPVTLGELKGAGDLDFGDGYRTRADQLASEGFRILRAADVLDGAVSLTGPDFVGVEHASAIGSKRAQAGDVVLTSKGTVGRVARMPALNEPVVYSPQLCYLRPRVGGRLEAAYLQHWLHSAEFAAQAGFLMHNTDMAPYISLRDLSSMRISLPPLPEQRAIAEVLGALDDKIAANTRQADLADLLANAHARVALGGEWATLDEVAVVVMGSSPPGSALNEIGIGVPFFQGVRDFGTRSPRLRVWTTGPTRMAAPGDILLSVRAPVGQGNVATEASCIGRGLASIRSRTGTQASLLHLLRFAEWSPYQAEGTIFASITGPQLREVRLPLPKDPAALERIIAPLERTIASLLRESQTLAGLRDTLLPQLMSGTLRVRDAERAVEDAL